MNRKPLNYIAIKIALCLSIFITQANAEGLPKEFNIKEVRLIENKLIGTKEKYRCVILVE